MANNICIYRIDSIAKPERFYIGSTKDFNRRKAVYLSILKRGDYKNRKLQNHYNKYGVTDFVFSVVENVADISQLLEREQYYLDTLQPWFNILKLAANCSGVKRSSAVKNKISLSLKKWNMENVSPNKGRALTDAVKDKIRAKAKGRFSGENHPLYGTNRSEKTKQLLRIVNVGKKASESTKEKLKNKRALRFGASSPSKAPVKDNATGIIYPTLKMAVESLNLQYQTTYAMLSGRNTNKTTLNFVKNA